MRIYADRRWTTDGTKETVLRRYDKRVVVVSSDMSAMAVGIVCLMAKTQNTDTTDLTGNHRYELIGVV
jgi:hypothetical protein